MGAGFLSKRSIVQFQLALDQDPNDWIANYGVGMNYLHWPDYFGKNDASIAYFEHAIAIQEARPIRPSDILAYVRLGDALAKAGKLELAQATWKRGIARVGQHPDLSERLNIPTTQLHQAVVDAYNPNNSIGAIDTDISILWSEIMPTKVLSLRGNNNQIVVGSMGKPAQPNAEANSATKFFSWFRDNLPLLIRRDQANQVNMQGIGATSQAGVGIIAHNMVKGFMTQFRGDASAQVIDMLNQAPSYERPFFHEGIGMGLGAALDTSASGSLAPFASQIAVFAPNFERLHYAGLGMWFGLAPTVNLVRIRTKLNELSARGQFYAHEGLGFAVVLFNTNLDPAVQLVQRLPFALAATFAHGAGRALWIKYGNDAASVSQALGKFPDRMQSDVQAGFGMGVAFTRVDQLDVILAQTIPLRQLSATACGNYLTGTAMGLSIRYQADPVYMRTMLKSKASPQSQQLARISLQAGMDALQDITQIGVEMHQNWRAAIRTQFSTGQAATLVKDICETSTP
jgi:tetratricopeptide (TPR) repeat protein